MTVTQKYREVIHSEWFKKFKADDISITFQEWCLYWFLRARNSNEELTEELLSASMKNALIDYWDDKSWNECSASKFNEKVINKRWIEVF